MLEANDVAARETDTEGSDGRRESESACVTGVWEPRRRWVVPGWGEEEEVGGCFVHRQGFFTYSV